MGFLDIVFCLKGVVGNESHLVFICLKANKFRGNDLVKHENKKGPDTVKTVNDPLVEDRRWLNTSLQTGSPT